MSSSLLEAVQELAKLTGDVAMRHYRTALTVETKQDGSPVTAADRQAEEAARAWLAKRFPEDGITGEELGDMDTQDLFIEISRTIDKHLWFVEAHLQA